MCGISAIIQKDPSFFSRSVVEGFNNIIAHRGPDGEGFEYFPDPQRWTVALAHRRLSIIDLTDTGKQPMSYEQDRYWLTFNGEIYNYLEIKSELVKLGFHFRGSSDTEVILASYQAWGTAAFKKFRGMWGLVLFDRSENKVIVSRDRMGIKPLYYHSNSSYIAFASEIKQFSTLPGFVAKSNKAVVKQYLLTGFERTDRTFFEGVIPVPPGSFIVVDANTMQMISATSFWEPSEIKQVVKNEGEAAEEFISVYEESLRIHLRSDVPVGCQLSGGLDSSSILALMQQHYRGDAIHSFTIQFPGYEKDETSFVNKMLEGGKTVSHFTSPTADQFSSELKDFIWHHDEPVGSFAHFAGFALARLIADHKIKVVLNGQGGDEILGGYWQQYYAYLFSLMKSGQVVPLVGNLIGALKRNGNEQLIKQIPSMLVRYRSRNRTNPLAFTQAYRDLPSLQYLDEYFAMPEGERRIFEIRNLILPRLLKWDDRNLMSFGVEGRYPLLDHKVIETALTFHSSVLYKDGWTKYPLRLAMKNKVPREIYFRKSKWGFETPQQHWLNHALKPLLKDWVNSDKPLDQVLVNGQIKKLAHRFWECGKLEDAQSLLRLFLMDKWFQVFSVTP